jgi:hypothetical protein
VLHFRSTEVPETHPIYITVRNSFLRYQCASLVNASVSAVRNMYDRPVYLCIIQSESGGVFQTTWVYKRAIVGDKTAAWRGGLHTFM